jgi:HD-GYP domain-containing protein (c-di-GMP phosphodiesterase class II)
VEYSVREVEVEAGDHQRAVAELAVAVADELGLGAAARKEVEMAAFLHDIGKVAIPETLLQRRGDLDAAERELVATHTIIGQRLLDSAGASLSGIGRIVRSCHERWDGTGYPDGLAGEDIPLAARIVACCDAYDAMISERPYSEAVTRARAIEELWSCAGTHFDPGVVAVFVRALERREARAEGAPEAKAPETKAPEATTPRALPGSARATSG